MPRHTESPARRTAPLRRAAATAGLTVAALVVTVGGHSVATSAALAEAPGDRFAAEDLFRAPQGEVSASLDGARAAARAAALGEADRSARTPSAAGLPSTSAEAQAWLDEVGTLEATLAQVAAAEAEAARIAAEAEAARLAAEEAARVEAERLAAEEAARVEAERVAAEHAEAEAEAAEQAAANRATDPGSNRALGRELMLAWGFGEDQWSCLDNLWNKESDWEHDADNPSSSAYGIPQALPGSKMASAGSDWETNPTTQIQWGLGYIDGRYGSPCAAWSHSKGNNWY